MFFLVPTDSVQQSNKIDCSLLAMTAFNICIFLDKNSRGFRFLHLGPGIRVPGPESRVPDSRIHLSILGINQGLKNYTDLFRLWTFFRSDLIDVTTLT